MRLKMFIVILLPYVLETASFRLFECVVGIFLFRCVVWWFRAMTDLSCGLNLSFCWFDSLDFVCLGSLFGHLGSLFVVNFSLY